MNVSMMHPGCLSQLSFEASQFGQDRELVKDYWTDDISINIYA